jgi:hypothetical protein
MVNFESIPEKPAIEEDEKAKMKEIVKKELLSIKEKFEKNHNIFLGEEDIRCHLFSALLNHFSNPEQTKDKKYTIPLHAQLSLYDEEGKLKEGEKPDIVILDVAGTDLRPRDGEQFHFKKAFICIEIKLNWTRRSETIKDQIKEEETKRIENMQQRENSETFFYLLYCDKKGRLSEEDVKKINNEHKNIEVIYANGRKSEF